MLFTSNYLQKSPYMSICICCCIVRWAECNNFTIDARMKFVATSMQFSEQES